MYLHGFFNCATEVHQSLASIKGIAPNDLHARVMLHLSTVLQNLSPPTHLPKNPSEASVVGVPVHSSQVPTEAAAATLLQSKLMTTPGNTMSPQHCKNVSKQTAGKHGRAQGGAVALPPEFWVNVHLGEHFFPTAASCNQKG